jgi:choline dehydrogenase-like flavoprotein
VRLGATTDAFGVPRLAVDLRFAERDAESVVAAHELWGRGLIESGIGRLDHWYAPSERVSRILAAANDGYHQVGVTRMAAAGDAGVVNRDLAVRGARGLWTVSSGVFPTSGQANPTMLAMQLGIRLAAQLASRAGVGSQVRTGT